MEVEVDIKCREKRESYMYSFSFRQEFALYVVFRVGGMGSFCYIPVETIARLRFSSKDKFIEKGSFESFVCM